VKCAPPSTERHSAPGSVIASTVRGSTLSAWITRPNGSARTVPSASRRCARSDVSRTHQGALVVRALGDAAAPVGAPVDPRGELAHPGQRAREGVSPPEPAVFGREAPGAVGHARRRRDGAAGVRRGRWATVLRAHRAVQGQALAHAHLGGRGRANEVPRARAHGRVAGRRRAGGAARAGGRQQREGERQAAHRSARRYRAPRRPRVAFDGRAQPVRIIATTTGPALPHLGVPARRLELSRGRVVAPGADGREGLGEATEAAGAEVEREGPRRRAGAWPRARRRCAPGGGRRRWRVARSGSKSSST
jgi:hypothetical protein